MIYNLITYLSTIVYNVLKMYRLGILDTISFLSEMGLLPESTTKEITSLTLTSSNELPQVTIDDFIIPSSIPSSYHNDNDNTSLHTTRYSKDFIEMNLIGKGGFGVVFHARHKLDNKDYAIKKVEIYICTLLYIYLIPYSISLHTLYHISYILYMYSISISSILYNI